MFKLYATPDGTIIQHAGSFFRPASPLSFDELFAESAPHTRIARAVKDSKDVAAPIALLAPIQSQEVWAAGVTYWRSRTARMTEAKAAGGGTFYDKVYEAERPELFFKSTPHRVAGPGGGVRIRADSHWNVPEPELTLALNTRGQIFGYTIGNDMSSRDIEGENPLYLPQAKVYDRSAALGPCLLVGESALPPDTAIALEIRRGGQGIFSDSTQVAQIRRPLTSLAAFLFRENSFPHGCYLMTGTGIVPPDGFTLARGDEIRITIEPIGTLVNTVL